MNVLESKFPEYQATPDDEPPVLITIHTKYFNKLIYTPVPPFKHLVEFDKYLLLIPHSNSYSESIFSKIRKICTDGCHNLGKDVTPGHLSTSVYTETTSIRNNLLEILIPKINIFEKKKSARYEWETKNFN